MAAIVFFYLHNLGSIKSVSDTLPDNLSRQYNILQHCLMHGSECSAAGTLNCGTLLWWPHYPSGGNQDHILQVYSSLIYNQMKHHTKKGEKGDNFHG